VTELVARPLLSLWWPELTAVVQPLAGEWAARRTLMESLSIPVGYGIELAALIDTAAAHGLDAIAQVDLGRRGHKHQASHDLALMAAELLLVAERRRAVTGESAVNGEIAVTGQRAVTGETAVTGQTAVTGETAVIGRVTVIGQTAAQRGQSPSQQPVELRQFVRVDGEMQQRSRPVPVVERPPARSVRIAPR
jgi:hypothetical protein